MKKQILIGILLLILFSTIKLKQNFQITKFNIIEINIENNSLINDVELQKSLKSIYNKNLIFLKNNEIEEVLKQNSLIESFKIKKIYPSTLNIKIFEKKLIAILFQKKKRFYLSDKIELINYKNIKKYENLPFIFGNQKEFAIFYKNLKTINFPFDIIKKYTFFDSKRWDLETSNGTIIKLPDDNYIESLQNYLKIKNKKGFKKYVVFDYRIKNQLILK
tara:strand:+ start:104 stop:760 length:657 start_codon:yes stop_codon:yes gene_type:complete